MDFSPVSNIMNNENVNDEDRDESGEFAGTVATARERIRYFYFLYIVYCLICVLVLLP